jgi:hypothetical protein
MTVELIGRELDDIVRELYALPPADFVAARNELVRQARAAGSRDVAERLQRLRRPTRSAWLVNLLASDAAAMHRLSALGRELRDAQTGLAGADLRNLAEQRRHLFADLLARARAHAAEAGVRVTATVLLEVEATLQAALVDLAGALTIRNGRLVRPLSHSGFGRRPRINVRDIEAAIERPHPDLPGSSTEVELPPVEDELAARRRAVAGRWSLELVDETDRTVVEDDSDRAPHGGGNAPTQLRAAEEELAAAEAAHWQSEFDLADAEGAVDAADDRLSSVDTQRIEARRDKVTAQRHLAEAKSRQRDAVNALADARRRLDAARRLADAED